MLRPALTRALSVQLAAAMMFGLVACSFDGSNRIGLAGDGGSAGPDGRFATVDASPGCPFSSDALCNIEDPDGALDISGDALIDTDVDPRCRDFAQPDGPLACLIWVEGVNVRSGARITGVGSRPLLIGTPNDVEIAGLIDVSSRRTRQTGSGANHETCSHVANPEDDPGGAGGAAGGSFAGRGGDGGIGDSDESLGFDGQGQPGEAGEPVSLPSVVRGGCPGGRGGDEGGFLFAGEGGRGGASGGALGLFAGRAFALRAGGRLRATGAGGSGGEVQAGGGGGGSGGMILIEAATVDIAGEISANGGGGGEGGIRRGVPRTGNGGDDGAFSTQAAEGGSGLQGAGNGGDGSSLADVAGGVGDQDIGGGGGGGGGAGYVSLRGALTVTGTITPPATEQ